MIERRALAVGVAVALLVAVTGGSTAVLSDTESVTVTIGGDPVTPAESLRAGPPSSPGPAAAIERVRPTGSAVASNRTVTPSGDDATGTGDRETVTDTATAAAPTPGRTPAAPNASDAQTAVRTSTTAGRAPTESEGRATDSPENQATDSPENRATATADAEPTEGVESDEPSAPTATGDSDGSASESTATADAGASSDGSTATGGVES